MKLRVSSLGWVPVFWYAFFLLVPIVLIVITSFTARGTYGGIDWSLLSFDNFSRALDPLYGSILLRSFFLATATALCCVMIGFPVALVMATAGQRVRSVLVLLIAVPFLTNLTIRICAIKSFASYDGPLAYFLTLTGVPFDPFALSQNWPLVIYGMISTYLPFMVFPLYAALERFDFSLVEAAQDLGASYLQIITKVILPNLRKAFSSGLLLVFIPALGEFLIPDLLGGAKTMLAGNLISEQFLKARDWPFGSALSVILILALGFSVFAISIYGRDKKRYD